MAEAASDLELTDLPARLQAIAATLGSMFSEGYSKAEIARYYAKSRPWVSARLQELEDDLRRLIGRSDDSTESAGSGSPSSSAERTP